MDRRRIVTLILVSIVAMVVTITGASFAYFSSTFNVSDSTGVGAITEAASPSFMSTSSGSIDIDVQDYLMTEEIANNENTSDQLTDSANLSIFLTSAKNNVVSTCTYDIIFVWNDGADIYTRTPSALREFTISASAETNANDRKPADDAEGSKFEVTTKSLGEKNIDDLDWKNKTVVEKDAKGEVQRTMRYAVLIDDAKISSAYLRNATAVNWNFVIKFYNIRLNQETLKAKNYGGVIRVDPDSIKC